MPKKSYWILRLGLLTVFVCLGIQKIMDPVPWVHYVPQWLELTTSVSSDVWIYIIGTLEICLGLGLLYEKTLRLAADGIIIFLTAVIIYLGLSMETIKNIGLLAMAISLVVWKK